MSTFCYWISNEKHRSLINQKKNLFRLFAIKEDDIKLQVSIIKFSIYSCNKNSALLQIRETQFWYRHIFPFPIFFFSPNREEFPTRQSWQQAPYAHSANDLSLQVFPSQQGSDSHSWEEKMTVNKERNYCHQGSLTKFFLSTYASF